MVRELGGRPFLTDATHCMWEDERMHWSICPALMKTALICCRPAVNVIIGDGLKGTDDVFVPVAGGEYVKEAKIGKAIMDADVFISLTHFKGHEMTGFGGCIKNIGMGCGSRGGKMEMHRSGKPNVDHDKCVGCKTCARNCAHGAISFGDDRKASIDHEKCVGCGRCLGACNLMRL